MRGKRWLDGIGVNCLNRGLHGFRRFRGLKPVTSDNPLR